MDDLSWLIVTVTGVLGFIGALIGYIWAPRLTYKYKKLIDEKRDAYRKVDDFSKLLVKCLDNYQVDREFNEWKLLESKLYEISEESSIPHNDKVLSSLIEELVDIAESACIQSKTGDTSSIQSLQDRYRFIKKRINKVENVDFSYRPFYKKYVHWKIMKEIKKRKNT